MKHPIAIPVLCTALACLAGCSTKPEMIAAKPTGSGVTVKYRSIKAGDLEAVPKSTKPYKLALVVKTRNNPFFDPMIREAESEAKGFGVGIEIVAPAQESDKEQQFTMVQNLVAKKVDAILIAPADSKGIVPALVEAQSKGILVVNIDNRIDGSVASAAGLKAGGYVGADNEEGGKMAGQAMVGLVGGGDVAVLEGIRGTDNAEARKRGFSRAIEGKLKLVSSESADWDTQKAYAKFQSVLATHPGIKGLFCANDKMALGAIKALAEANKKGRIKVIGYDNIPDVKPYLASREISGTIEQHPDLMGKYGVCLAVGILSGKVQPGAEFLVPLEFVVQ